MSSAVPVYCCVCGKLLEDTCLSNEDVKLVCRCCFLEKMEKSLDILQKNPKDEPIESRFEILDL